MAHKLMLKLYARSSEDVRVLSSYMQDALVRVGDITRIARPPKLVAMTSRFCWEKPTPRRIRTALQIGGVQSVASHAIARAKPEAVLSLLAMEFVETDSPAGRARLIFSGGGEINLTLEACEMAIEDVSESWAVKSRPQHEPK